jgi:GTPase SAR1 family protein
MGCLCSSSSFFSSSSSSSSSVQLLKKEEKETIHSNDVQAWLEKEQEKKSKCKRVLLLGIENAGKSTFLKQFKHFSHVDIMKEYSKSEWIEKIQNNIIQTLTEILNHLERNVLLETKEEQKELALAKILLQQKKYEEVWQVAIVQGYYQFHRSQFPDTWSNEDCLPLLNRIAILFHPYYEPLFEDVLSLRQPSRGVEMCEIPIPNKKNSPLLFIDVAGQRTKRSKWFHYITSDIDLFIYIVSLSDFNRYDLVYNTKLEESLSTFCQLYIEKWFFNKTVIILFNKLDLFQYKIETLKVSFKQYFPSYTAGDHDVSSMTQFIQDVFLSHCNSSSSSNSNKSTNSEHNHRIYSFFTSAIDSTSIRVICSIVTDIVLGQQMSDLHLL